MKRLDTRRFGWLRATAGAASVEFAIIAMVAIATLLGVIEFGRAMDVRNQMAQAIDFGARKILLNPAATDAEITAAIKSAFYRGKAADLNVAAPVSETVNGRQYKVLQATYPFSLVIPGLGSPINLQVLRRVPVL